MNKNFIAGEWVDGDSAIENRNPSDISDLIGSYAQASTSQLETALCGQRSRQHDDPQGRYHCGSW